MHKLGLGYPTGIQKPPRNRQETAKDSLSGGEESSVTEPDGCSRELRFCPAAGAETSRFERESRTLGCSYDVKGSRRGLGESSGPPVRPARARPVTSPATRCHRVATSRSSTRMVGFDCAATHLTGHAAGRVRPQRQRGALGPSRVSSAPRCASPQCGAAGSARTGAVPVRRERIARLSQSDRPRHSSARGLRFVSTPWRVAMRPWTPRHDRVRRRWADCARCAQVRSRSPASVHSWDVVDPMRCERGAGECRHHRKRRGPRAGLSARCGPVGRPGPR